MGRRWRSIAQGAAAALLLAAVPAAAAPGQGARMGAGGAAEAPRVEGTPTACPAGYHPLRLLAYWAVWGQDPRPRASLLAHGRAITYLSPFWYTLEGSGALRSRERDHAQVLRAASRVGARVLALVTSGSGVVHLLATAAGRARAAAALSGVLRANPGLDGLMIDFETLPPTARGDLVALVAAVRRRLPADRLLGVAVAPKTSSPGRYGFQRLDDYSALGRYANLVQLMTYDRHYPGGPPGPIAPTAWVAAVARFARTRIPADKLLLGIPSYGYDWSGPQDAARTIAARAAPALALRLGVPLKTAPRVGGAYFTYRAGGVRHTVWFETPAGIAAAARLARELGLLGLALWDLGEQQTSFWPVLQSLGCAPGA